MTVGDVLSERQQDVAARVVAQEARCAGTSSSP